MCIRDRQADVVVRNSSRIVAVVVRVRYRFGVVAVVNGGVVWVRHCFGIVAIVVVVRYRSGVIAVVGRVVVRPERVSGGIAGVRRRRRLVPVRLVVVELLVERRQL